MLARHSKVAPASAKESQFFACDYATVVTNLSWYLSLFDAAEESVLLDGSTWYFCAPEAPVLISKCLQNSKVVLCLRDPAQRVFSSYLHMKKQVPSRELRSFDEIIKNIEKSVQMGESVYEAEDIALEYAVQKKLTDADYLNESFHKDRFDVAFPTRLSDRRFAFRYFSHSCYSHWLPLWEETFGDRLLIVYFEDLIRESEKGLRRILDFMGLNYERGIDELVKKNETRILKGEVSRRIIEFRKDSDLAACFVAFLKSIGLSNIGATFIMKHFYRDKEQATAEQMKRVRMLLKDEYKYWAKRDSETNTLWGISALERKTE